jgi:putative transcriptional regulator
MDSLRGQLLIASPAIMDPNFRQTVVLLAEHTEEGAMGVVLNREADVTVGEAVPELAPLAGDDAAVHVGGPVSDSAVTVLAEFREPEHAALLVDEDLGFIPAEVEDGAALAAAVRRARVYAGHAGWGPGQLDGELAANGWFVVERDDHDLWLAEPAALWRRVLRRQPGRVSVFADFPADPSLN